jgi:N-acetylmuramoyl-L-alanine amidase CwlA
MIMVPILQDYIPLGHPNRRGTKLLSVTALVFHYTANEERDMGDTATAEFFKRPWHTGSDGKSKEWQLVASVDPTSKKPTTIKQEINFAFGSAQVIADEDSVTETMPLDEVAWGCGDQRFPYTELNKGQQPASRIWFNNQPNERTLNIEICNNADWNKAVKNASDWAVQWMLANKRTVSIEDSLNCQVMGVMFPGQILCIRHFDVSGKMCPKPFIDDQNAWVSFVNNLAKQVNV